MTESPRADRFIELFNQLDDRLRAMTGVEDRTASFGSVVRAAAGKDAVVRRNRDALMDFAELRNAIIHDHSYPRHVIAEPLEATLRQFESIVLAVTKPRRVDEIMTRSPLTFRASDSAGRIVQQMAEHHYSQVIVVTDAGLALLTSEHLAVWLGSHAAEGVRLEDVSAGELLAAWPEHTITLLARGTTAARAVELFESTISARRAPIFGIVITEHGKANEKPLGIVCPWDLIDLLADTATS